MPTPAEVTYPPEDKCEHPACGRTRAEHDTPWSDGGPGHEYVAPERKPRPEHITGCHIQTDWTCTHCGTNNDVWGAADGWMECGQCQGMSYLVPLLTEPTEPKMIGAS